LLANIPRLEAVARIVLYQHKHYDGSGLPADAIRGEDIPIGARILKVLMDLLELEAQKMPKAAALALMQQRQGWYDPGCWMPPSPVLTSLCRRSPRKAKAKPLPPRN